MKGIPAWKKVAGALTSTVCGDKLLGFGSWCSVSTINVGVKL